MFGGAVYEYRIAEITMIDADTASALIDLGMHVHIATRIRLAGLDAPERHTAEGAAAKTWVAGWFTAHPGPYVVATRKTEKYGRWLGTLTAADGHVLNDDLLAAGHAKPYQP